MRTRAYEKRFTGKQPLSGKEDSQVASIKSSKVPELDNSSNLSAILLIIASYFQYFGIVVLSNLQSWSYTFLIPNFKEI